MGVVQPPRRRDRPSCSTAAPGPRERAGPGRPGRGQPPSPPADRPWKSESPNSKRSSRSITKGQERIRKNMEALDHKSDLYRRYVGELDKQETQIGGLLTAEQDARQEELASARADLRRYLAGLSL